MPWGGGGGGGIVAFAVSVVGGCFCLCLNSTFTDAVKNFIWVLYVDQLQNLHLKCLEVQCTGLFMCTSDMYASPGTCV